MATCRQVQNVPAPVTFDSGINWPFCFQRLLHGAHTDPVLLRRSTLARARHAIVGSPRDVIDSCRPMVVPPWHVNRKYPHLPSCPPTQFMNNAHGTPAPLVSLPAILFKRGPFPRRSSSLSTLNEPATPPPSKQELVIEAWLMEEAQLGRICRCNDRKI